MRHPVKKRQCLNNSPFIRIRALKTRPTLTEDAGTDISTHGHAISQFFQALPFGFRQAQGDRG